MYFFEFPAAIDTRQGQGFCSSLTSGCHISRLFFSQPHPRAPPPSSDRPVLRLTHLTTLRAVFSFLSLLADFGLAASVLGNAIGAFDR